MVDQMIKRSKNGFPVAKLSASNETMTRFKRKCAEIWSFVKQVWYVPFIWALAWFTYWIVQENVILSQPITQGNYINFVGFIISMIAIVAKGWISKKSKKDHVKERKIGIGKENSSEFLKTQSETSSNELQYWEFEQSGEQPEHYSTIDRNEIQQPTEIDVESISSLLSTEESAIGADGPNQNPDQEIPSDCLICPNLTNCDKRQKRLNEPGTKCPFAP